MNHIWQLLSVDDFLSSTCFMTSGHFVGCHGKKEICKAPAGEKDPVKHQQGKKTLLHEEEDPVLHQQGKNTMLSLSLVL